MTVCVFDPKEQIMWSDTAGMVGGYYSGDITKISQVSSRGYLHTIATAGTTWLCRAFESLLVESLQKTKIPYLKNADLQHRLNEITSSVPSIEGEQDAFDAIVVEYSVDANTVRVFKFNNTMFPFEFNIYNGDIIGIGANELVMAVSMAHDVVRDTHLGMDIGELIKRLPKYHAVARPYGEPSRCYVTQLSEDFAYVR